MKVRIGISPGPAALDHELLGSFADAIEELAFDSIWLAEVLTATTLDPLTALAWLAGRNPGLKLGTTMLLPGRHPVRLAKQVATVDALSAGRLLVTFVPGLAVGAERSAIGTEPARRAEAMEEVVPILRRLWEGEKVTASVGVGVGSIEMQEVAVWPQPVQDPFEIWVGGIARRSLERCGRLFDGWLPAMCTPEEAAQGHEVVNEAAEQAGRTVSPEHFGVSLSYAHGPIPDAVAAALATRTRGRPLTGMIPTGYSELRDLLEQFIAVGFSKFVVRPLLAPADWRSELEALAGAVGDLQSS